jgi:uncharacterized protein involved in exopolysaccharide biosynthesis
MEFYRIWRILVDNKWVLIWLPVVATCIGAGLTYVLPEQYESTALVLVRPYEEIKFDSSAGSDRKEIRDFPVNLSAPIDAPSKTFMEVIKSSAVARKIVDALQLHVKKPKNYESFFENIHDKVKTWIKSTTRTVLNYLKYGRDIRASPFDLAVEDIEKNLRVSGRKDTYAFDITYRSDDPNEAAAVANMAADIFLEQSSEAYRIEAARVRKFIEAQLDDSQKALEKARGAVLAYKQSGGTFELGSEYGEQLKIASDLGDTLAKFEGVLAGRRHLAERTGVIDSPNVIAKEAEIADLKQQISALQAQLAAYPDKERQMNSIIFTERLAERNYEFFFKFFEEARVKEAASVREIRVASRAVPSLYPVKPLKWVYAGSGFGIAMIAAIGWVLLFRTSRYVDETDAPAVGALQAAHRDDNIGQEWTSPPSPARRSGRSAVAAVREARPEEAEPLV